MPKPLDGWVRSVAKESAERTAARASADACPAAGRDQPPRRFDPGGRGFESEPARLFSVVSGPSWGQRGGRCRRIGRPGVAVGGAWWVACGGGGGVWGPARAGSAREGPVEAGCGPRPAGSARAGLLPSEHPLVLFSVSHDPHGPRPAPPAP